VNASSGAKTGIYTTPELKNLLQSMNDLKREVSRFGKGNPDRISYNRLLKNVDSLEESLRTHFRELNTFEETLVSASSRRLTRKQRLMLRWLSEGYGEATIYTSLIDQLSEDLGLPKSTVRWNLQGLREANLIRAGDRENKGIPVELTDAGRIMASVVVAEGD
jgi:DNA-binding transcriptional ArsR family regulator